MNKPKKTKVLIADDHSIVRMGIAALLRYQNDIEVLGEAEDGEEAVQLARKHAPDVVIMDLVMPQMDGVEATKAICTHSPGTKVLILTSFGTSIDISRAIAAGASGAILKDISNDRLIEAIHEVAEGRKVFSPEIEQLINEDNEVPEFTQRQLDILHSVTRGLTNTEIAKQFGISTDGVKQHCLKIFKKLGAANRSEAVAIAMRRSLLKMT